MNKGSKNLLSALLGLLALPILQTSGMASEITIPSQMPDTASPEILARFSYTQDGPFSDASGLPTYQWMPVDKEPKAIILGIHGLTLHGRRYRVLARTMALNGVGFVSMDYNGFGRCRWPEGKNFSTPTEDKKKLNHQKSYDAIVQMAKAIKKQYPNIPLIVLGESLGCTYCVKIAGEQADLVDGLVLSAPAVKVNPKMYMSKSEFGAGVAAIVKPHHKVNLHSFLTNLVSNRQAVINEMLDDPLIVKELSLFDLLGVDEFVEKTANLGKAVKEHLPVLIIQGSADGCVAPEHVTTLMMKMPSDDQTLCWRGNHGHLQLETSFVRATTIDALGDWIEDHSPTGKDRISILKADVEKVGGQLVK